MSIHRTLTPIKKAINDLPETIGYLAVLLTVIFMSVGWCANIVKIFYAVTWAEIMFRVMAALIFPIGAFYGYVP
jgi:hypothetical protein